MICNIENLICLSQYKYNLVFVHRNYAEFEYIGLFGNLQIIYCGNADEWKKQE